MPKVKISDRLQSPELRDLIDKNYFVTLQGAFLHPTNLQDLLSCTRRFSRLSRQALQIDAVRKELLHRFGVFHSTFHSSTFLHPIPRRLNLLPFSGSSIPESSLLNEPPPVSLKYLHTESPISLSLITQTSNNQVGALGSYYSRM